MDENVSAGGQLRSSCEMLSWIFLEGRLVSHCCFYTDAGEDFDTLLF